MDIPTKVFLTKGVGIHKDYLASFELALRDAGIEKCNIVSVSSILPPNCRIISREEGLKLLKPGQITFCVISRNSTNEPNRLVSAAIGVAMPKGENNYGYLSEHHSFGEKGEVSGEYAEDIAATMLATTLGVEFDSDKAWEEREQIYKASGHIFKTTNICQSAEGHKNGLWTTVIAVSVFVEGENSNHVAKTEKIEKSETKIESKPEIKPETKEESKSETPETKIQDKIEIKPENKQENIKIEPAQQMP